MKMKKKMKLIKHALIDLMVTTDDHQEKLDLLAKMTHQLIPMHPMPKCGDTVKFRKPSEDIGGDNVMMKRALMGAGAELDLRKSTIDTLSYVLEKSQSELEALAGINQKLSDTIKKQEEEMRRLSQRVQDLITKNLNLSQGILGELSKPNQRCVILSDARGVISVLSRSVTVPITMEEQLNHDRKGGVLGENTPFNGLVGEGVIPPEEANKESKSSVHKVPNKGPDLTKKRT